MSISKPEKLVKLQINTTGAWRDVMDFDAQDSDELLDAAEKLFEWGYTPNTKGIRLRVIVPGDVAPLMTWCENFGWQDWGKAQ